MSDRKDSVIVDALLQMIEVGCSIYTCMIDFQGTRKNVYAVDVEYRGGAVCTMEEEDLAEAMAAASARTMERLCIKKPVAT